MARIDAAYDYFLSTYGQNLGLRYESHKKSELRDTYNSILKSNKISPLYKIKDSAGVGQLAIDIKEHANSMNMAISNLTAGGDDIKAILDKKIATSSDSDVLDARYVGTSDGDYSGFEIEINSIATPQVNQGNFLDPSQRAFEEGQYSFDLDVRNGSYEFQFNVNPLDSNLVVQEKIMRLINSADVGLSAELVPDEKGRNALTITSKSTGLSEGEDKLFNIESNTCWRELNTLGIGNITSLPTNSSFRLNGVDHSSLSNTFTVNKAFELNIKSPSTSPVRVGLMADTDALSSGINTLLETYNKMLDLGNTTLTNELASIGHRMSGSLSSVGITRNEDGHLSLDSEKLASAINSGDRDQGFSVLNQFKDALQSQAKRSSINPMNYVDKLVVEYKNPSKTLNFPYASSQYSGMLVDYSL